MAQYKGASRDAHRAKTLEKRRERQKEEMELLKNKLSKVLTRSFFEGVFFVIVYL